jgi:peptidylprolyl isomerase
MNRFLIAASALALMAAPSLAADSLKVDTSKNCSFTIKLRADLAPKHVAQVTKLAGAGFYNGIVFHRVIDGFMAQTGDPTGTGMGGSKEANINAEFTKEHFARGAVGMARSQDPNSANSQFFVMLADGGFLDNQYTVWGNVDADGMKCVDQIKKGDPQSGAVDGPDSMTKVTVQ